MSLLKNHVIIMKINITQRSIINIFKETPSYPIHLLSTTKYECTQILKLSKQWGKLAKVVIESLLEEIWIKFIKSINLGNKITVPSKSQFQQREKTTCLLFWNRMYVPKCAESVTLNSFNPWMHFSRLYLENTSNIYAFHSSQREKIIYLFKVLGTFF